MTAFARSFQARTLSLAMRGRVPVRSRAPAKLRMRLGRRRASKAPGGKHVVKRLVRAPRPPSDFVKAGMKKPATGFPARAQFLR
jgi:hypothetical protein